MKKVALYQCLENKYLYVDEMKQNKIFVYPTDSLYWIWWLFSHANINKIGDIKHRHMGKKMNIVAPSFEWIFENFTIYNKDFLLESFSAFHATTFILEPKLHNSAISLYETSYEDNTIWVRILKHPFQEVIQELWKPFISTSANYAWNQNIKNISELPNDIINKVDYCIDWGNVAWVPSVLLFDKSRQIHKRD